MDGFLDQVSRHLIHKIGHDLRDVCIVFPNRRSGTYFVNAIKKQVNQNIWLPKIYTINEFIGQYSSLQQANQITLLTYLYKSYQKITHSQESFDAFYPWGEVILNDFDDIDKYMANSRGVLTNLSEIKRLDSNLDFLSEEQKEVIKTFFQSFDPERRSKLVESFMLIWEALLPIYEDFTQQLVSDRIAYEGLIYRQAAQFIADPAFEEPAFSKYLFVGFNAITKCEEYIFEKLKNRGKAEFYWDYDRSYIENKQHEAGWFLRQYILKFPAPADFLPSGIINQNSKQIHIVASPTQTGQLTFIADQLSQIHPEEWTQTALVLADENLLMDTLEHLNGCIGDLNVTMGYKVKHSLAGQMVDWLIQLALNHKINHQSDISFYYKPVKAIVQHPYIMAIEPEYAARMKELIQRNNFYFSQSELATGVIGKLIFKLVKSPQEFAVNLSLILTHFIHQFSMLDHSEIDWGLEMELIYPIILQNNQLANELNNNLVVIELPTYFRILKQVINGIKVPFEGEPVKGVQIMGFLETRNLDFKHVIITNANEGILPLNGSTSSFIPFSLRKGFGLPTREEREAIYGYYFYRLMQKADNITLVYCNNSQGNQNGEKSRYLMQLLYSGFKVNEYFLTGKIGFQSPQKITIAKNTEILKLLTEYTSSDMGKYLSPSALVTYLICPLQFYFKHMLKLSSKEQIDETIDARLFGNIFHTTAELIYRPFLESKKEVTSVDIDGLIDNTNEIENIIQKSFNLILSGDLSENEMDIKGKNELVRHIMRQYIHGMLKHDRQYCPFSIIALEKKHISSFDIRISEKNYKVQVGGTIDRIDRTSGSVRIVDYKTGSNELISKNITDVFDSNNIEKNKGILQTLLYCQVYSLSQPNEANITPYLYLIKSLFHPNVDFKVKLTDEIEFALNNFKKIESTVYEKLLDLLTEIFDPNKPFTQTKKIKNCEHCDFNSICGRQFSKLMDD